MFAMCDIHESRVGQIHGDVSVFVHHADDALQVVLFERIYLYATPFDPPQKIKLYLQMEVKQMRNFGQYRPGRKETPVVRTEVLHNPIVPLVSGIKECDQGSAVNEQRVSHGVSL